jgi:hypothetical protein
MTLISKSNPASQLTPIAVVLRRGVELAIELKQHLFDTYYHAVALETADGMLITADERYLRAAGAKGRIISLMDWDESAR